MFQVVFRQAAGMPLGQTSFPQTLGDPAASASSKALRDSNQPAQCGIPQKYTYQTPQTIIEMYETRSS